jgi:photosystem II stability/assembly factor-like uncharacterized protein
MTGWSWRDRGTIDHAAVTHLALSPWFAVDRSVAAATPAGLHLSQDGGATWDIAAAVGPFVVSLAVSRARNLLVASASGLHFSRDWGDTWHIIASRSPIAAVAFTDAGFVVFDTAGAVWSGNLDTPGLTLRHELPDAPFAVAQVGGDLYALGAGLWRSSNGGSSWEGVPLPPGCDAGEDIVAAGDRCLLAPVNGDRLWSLGPDGWSPVALPDGIGAVDALAASTSGKTVAAGCAGAICISGDAGRTWRVESVGHPVTSVAVAGSGSAMVAGLADGSVIASAEQGRSWSTSRLRGGTVVARLIVHDGVVRATTVEGTVLEAGISESFDARTVRELDESLPLDVPAIDGEIVATVSDSETGAPVAVGTRSPGGAFRIWVRGYLMEWRAAISHPDPARALSLAHVPGSGAVYAGIGDSVYRPSRAGAGMFAREPIDLDRVREVLAVAAGRDGLVVAITDAGLYRSDDDGLSWTAIPSPDGPPVTAIAVVDTHDGCEVLAAQLGGGLVSCRLR